MAAEEKKAIEFVKNLIKTIEENQMLFDEAIMLKAGETTHDNLQILLNIIQKQQAKLEKKNKIIDLMTEYIDINCDCIKGFDKCEQIDDPHCLKCIKQYFEKQVESEDKQC
ncbi:MAG: hypothetical protein HFJ30_10375 [Clostridia bacterium]|jgi:hypothetical protein|nr:hypothetical protein [Clostridia bacterium]